MITFLWCGVRVQECTYTKRHHSVHIVLPAFIILHRSSDLQIILAVLLHSNVFFLQMSPACNWVMLTTYHRRLQATNASSQSCKVPQQTCCGKTCVTLCTRVRDVSLSLPHSRSFTHLPSSPKQLSFCLFPHSEVILSQIFMFACSAFVKQHIP